MIVAVYYDIDMLILFVYRRSRIFASSKLMTDQVLTNKYKRYGKAFRYNKERSTDPC